MSDKMTLRRIVAALGSHAYRYADEHQLHDGLAVVLDQVGISYEREYIAGPKDRFDFLCDGGIVIEAKIDGSLPVALRQVGRYCARDEVAAVVLVTTRQWGRTRALRPDASLHGKPLRLVSIRPQAF